MITIPVVMIGLDDYEDVATDLDAGVKVEASISMDLAVIQKGHPLFEEVRIVEGGSVVVGSESMGLPNRWDCP